MVESLTLSWTRLFTATSDLEEGEDHKHTVLSTSTFRSLLVVLGACAMGSLWSGEIGDEYIGCG